MRLWLQEATTGRANLAATEELLHLANVVVYWALLGMTIAVAGACVIGFVWFCKWLLEQLEQ